MNAAVFLLPRRRWERFPRHGRERNMNRGTPVRSSRTTRCTLTPARKHRTRRGIGGQATGRVWRALPQEPADSSRRSINTPAERSETTSTSFIIARVAPTNSLRTARSSSSSKSISARMTAGADCPLNR